MYIINHLEVMTIWFDPFLKSKNKQTKSRTFIESMLERFSYKVIEIKENKEIDISKTKHKHQILYMSTSF